MIIYILWTIFLIFIAIYTMLWLMVHFDLLQGFLVELGNLLVEFASFHVEFNQTLFYYLLLLCISFFLLLLILQLFLFDFKFLVGYGWPYIEGKRKPSTLTGLSQDNREEHWRIRHLKEAVQCYSNLLNIPCIEMNTIWEPVIKKTRLN